MTSLLSADLCHAVCIVTEEANMNAKEGNMNAKEGNMNAKEGNMNAKEGSMNAEVWHSYLPDKAGNTIFVTC